MFRHRGAAYAFAFVIALPPCAHAQSPAQTADAQALRSAIDDLKKDFEQRLAALEMRLTAVETAEQQRGAAPAAAGAPNAPATSAAPQATAPALAVSPESTTGASVSNAKVFNPDIAVIGDFLGAVGHPNADPSNRKLVASTLDAE